MNVNENGNPEPPAKKFPDESVESLSLEAMPGASISPEAVPELLSQLKLRLKLHGGAEIEIPLDEIDMGSARFRSRFQREGAAPAPAARFARCGNCGAKLPLTGDATTDHHTAMRHKFEDCNREKQAQAQDEHRQLVSEFQDQRRLQLPQGAGLPALPAAATPPKKNWFQRLLGDGQK